VIGPAALGRHRIVLAVAGATAVLAALLAAPVVMFASGGFLAVSGASCAGVSGSGEAQPDASQSARNSIPASYLALFRSIGAQYGVPWAVLAGIGKVESDDGQTTLPGVQSGANAFGAAGPMQIGIGGAAGDEWGGAAVHPASERVNGVATDANGDGIASVYEPADAIAGAAKYLLVHGVLTNVAQAIFAYNHLESYVQAVLYWAGQYASAGDTVSQPTQAMAPQCLVSASEAGPAGQGPPGPVRTAIAYAEQQLGKPYQFSQGPGGQLMIGSYVCPAQSGFTGGATSATHVVHAGLDLAQRCAALEVVLYAADQLGKPYQWGATGPDAFDCSGLAMMAYRAAGVAIPRTSQQQWAFGPRVAPSAVEPGDLVFFAGSDGTMTAPGHVGIVIGQGLMIDAPFTGADIRIEPYAGTAGLVGFTRPEA
jgi:cell wall-associated NlpC family hydrolase